MCLASPAGGSAESGDVAATNAYLAASYAYWRTVLGDVPATRAAVEGFAGTLRAECAGVLKDASREDFPESSTSFARSVGESKREDEQLSELENELGGAFRSTVEASERAALLTFADTVRPLHWSNPILDQQVSAALANLEERLARPMPSVCADMKAWVASGYRTLPAATKALRAEQEATAEHAFVRPAPSIASLLAPYESASEKALIAKTKKLNKERAKALAGIAGVYGQLAATLGIARERESTIGHPAAGSIALGKGRLEAGGSYEVTLTPPQAAAGRRQDGCESTHPLNVSIVSTRIGGVSGCFSRSEVSLRPRVECNEGLLRIQALTLPAARSVSLRLSNGRQVTSPVALVPPQLGGPVGFYYQVVRGPKPIPVSLSELDAHDRSVRVWKLERRVGCTKHVLKFLNHGIRPLVHDSVSGGPPFTIVGEAFHFFGRIHFALHVDITDQGGGGESPRGERPKLFSWALYRGCKPQQYAIVYGLLKAPRDTVLARTSGVLRPLHKVAIPAHLHAGGLLVYAAATAVPSELIVRDPDGNTILTEKLGRRGAEATETCEGETEGAVTNAG